ncbi:putative mitochondrial protein [Senna tora]|uniref:Putative mitochondrial protein n=1 Tax=Senna tora TaxID=362788 RepID=A0A834WYP4_9FABA|nr:putative mitochondrial protein [Senna tora]
MSNFFWRHNGNSPKIHLQNYKLLCRPKLEGGLALCDVQAFNEALLAKHVWRLVGNEDNHPCSLLAAKYMDVVGMLYAPSTSSWRWKAIMNHRDIIISNLQWQIGKSEKKAKFPSLEGEGASNKALSFTCMALILFLNFLHSLFLPYVIRLILVIVMVTTLTSTMMFGFTAKALNLSSS